MIRILHIMGCSDAGGISTVVYNYYSHMDRSKYHFDVLLTVPGEGMNAERLRALGCEIFHTVPKSQDAKRYQADLEELLAGGKYQAVHVHENETSYVALRIAKKMGIACRFAHSHTSSPYSGLKGELKRLSGILLNSHYATGLLACGKLAGDRVFGKCRMKSKKAMILPNAIDLTEFAFSDEKRNRIRKELQLEDAFVLAMVGRLAPEKNVTFALQVLQELVQTRPEAVLLLVGDGELKDSLAREIHRRKLDANVRMTRRRSDVNCMYSAADVLVMPSIHEGFPTVVVEATAAGLPVLLSDTVTSEFSAAGNVKYLPINDPRVWYRELNGLHCTRVNCSLFLGQYNISDSSVLLEQRYLEG